MNKHTLSACSLLLMVSLPLSAADSKTDTDNTAMLHLSMETAARLAWDSARTVLIAHAQTSAQAANGRSHTAFLHPKIGLDADYTRQDDTTNSFGFASDSDVYSYNAHADIFLFGFGTRTAATQYAAQRNQAANADLHSARTQASFLMRTAIVDMWLAQEQAHIATLRVAQRRDECTDAQLLTTAGSASALELRTAQMHLAQTENKQRAAQTHAEIQRLRLSELLRPHLHADAHTLSYTIDGSLKDSITNSSLHRAHERVKNTSAVDQLHAQTRALEAAITQENSARLPQFSAHAGYAGSGDALDNTYDQWRIGIGMQWKLYDGGAHRANRASHTAQIQQLQQRSETLYDARRRFLQSAILQDAQLTAMLIQQKHIVALAEKNYADTRLLYQAGSTTITHLGDIGLALNEARHTRIQLHYQLHILNIQLQRFSEYEPSADTHATP